MITRSGRGVRWPVQALRTSGTQAINLGDDDRVISAVLTSCGASLLLLTADGYARRLEAKWIEIPSKPNRKGKSLVARKSAVVGTAVLATDTMLWAMTESQLLAIDAEALPLANSTKTQRLFKLPKGEVIADMLAVVHEPRVVS